MIGLIEEQNGGPRRYQLKITLKGFTPTIWRRVVVSSDMPLDVLHMLIQVVMGWDNSHLHQFTVGSRKDCTYYGTHDPDIGMGGDILDEERYTVADIAPAAKRKFIYEYDFGDSWRHEIVVEKILPTDPKFKHSVCLAGENACPPEDCGGAWGYADLLEALNDPRHPRHEDIKEWIGESWDASAFDLAGINQVLKRF